MSAANAAAGTDEIRVSFARARKRERFRDNIGAYVSLVLCLAVSGCLFAVFGFRASLESLRGRNAETLAGIRWAGNRLDNQTRADIEFANNMQILMLRLCFIFIALLLFVCLLVMLRPHVLHQMIKRRQRIAPSVEVVPISDARSSCVGCVFTVRACADSGGALVTGLWVGGDLGACRVFAAKTPLPTPSSLLEPPRDWREWVLVGSSTLAPAWIEPRRLDLTVNVPIAAGSERSFYVHCTAVAPSPSVSGGDGASATASRPLPTRTSMYNEWWSEHPPLLLAARCVDREVAASRTAHAEIFGGRAQLLGGSNREGGLFFLSPPEEVGLTPPEVVLVGGVATCALAAVPNASSVFGDAVCLISFERLWPDGIGPVNRKLISSWGDRVDDNRRLGLPSPATRLPPPPALPTPSSISGGAGDAMAAGGGGTGGATVGRLDHLWVDPIRRELWMQYLARVAPGEEWLASARMNARTARHLVMARQQEQASQAMWRLVTSAPKRTLSRRALSAVRGGVGLDRCVARAQSCLSALRSTTDTHTAAAADTTIVTTATTPTGASPREGAGSSSSSSSIAAALDALAAAADRALVRRVGGFERSREFACCTSLHSLEPTPASLTDFSLLRRVGRGAYGTVVAARKEDTAACFALKMVHVQRVSRKRALHHLKMERRVASLVASQGCPFLCELRYAFHTGPWLVLALPLYAGGTLQVHIDERGVGNGGFARSETRWVGAQLTLALEALHAIGVMHRDIKPHNVLVGHDGYLALTDFGLSAVLSADRETRREAPITNKCGTRGFWAPEVVQKLPQAEPADWWSLGVTLHMCATGTNPFRPETPADGSAAGESPAGLTREAEYNEKTMHSPIEPPEESLGPELTSLLLGLLTRQELSRLGSAPGGALSVKGHAFFRGVEWELLRAKRLPAPFLPDRNLVYCKDVIGHSDADEWRPGNGPPREERHRRRRNSSSRGRWRRSCPWSCRSSTSRTATGGTR
jgi:serine/threonine protein kinase